MMEKREKYAETVQNNNFADAYVAASADIIGDVSMAEGSSVWYQSVVRGDHDRIEIGEGSNIQDGCVLHADPGFPVMIGSYVTVGHKAIIHGCEIGDGALIGMGAIVLNGAKVGKNVDNSVDNVKNSLVIHKSDFRKSSADYERKMNIPMDIHSSYPQKPVDKTCYGK